MLSDSPGVQTELQAVRAADPPFRAAWPSEWRTCACRGVRGSRSSSCPCWRWSPPARCSPPPSSRWTRATSRAAEHQRGSPLRREGHQWAPVSPRGCSWAAVAQGTPQWAAGIVHCSCSCHHWLNVTRPSTLGRQFSNSYRFFPPCRQTFH